MDKNFLCKNQITEEILLNCLSQISLYSNRIKKLCDEPFFTWELLTQDVLERVIWLYNNSKVNIMTGEIIEVNPELDIKISKNVGKLNISLSHQEKDNKNIGLKMYAICLKENEWYTTIDETYRKSSGILLEKESTSFDNSIFLDFQKINTNITSILFCAYLANNDYKGDNLSALDFRITQTNSKTGKKTNRTFSFMKQINNSLGVIAFELIRCNGWWKIELVKEKAPETIEILTDSYGEYLPFR